MTLREICDQLSAGNEVAIGELLPYLSASSRQSRAQANHAVAEAYFKAGKVDRAKIFAGRAFLLSDFSEGALELHTAISKSAGDLEAIREAYKRVGMRHARQGNVLEAIKYFNLHQYVYPANGIGDKYKYDFDIIAAVEDLTAMHGALPEVAKSRPPHKKIRIAYLVFGCAHAGSVLIKIWSYFARHHDPSLFDVCFFFPENETWMPGQWASKDLTVGAAIAINIRKITGQGGRVVLTRSADEETCLFETAANINQYQPDILITTALLADYRQLFIKSLVDAPVSIGFHSGPKEQYLLPSLQWSICLNKHLLTDNPCDCSLVKLEVDLPRREDCSFATRGDLKLPADAIVLASAGREQKFLKPEFWIAIGELMEQNPAVCYLAVGLTTEPLFFSSLLPPAVRERIRLIGWRDDYLDVFGVADIVLDTFPSGGGVTIMEAMALSIPIVTFYNDYSKPFDANHWSPADEFVQIPELIVERGNFDEFKVVVTRLIGDRDYRLKMGQLCRETIVAEKGDPARMVRACEAVYVQVRNSLAALPNGAVPANANVTYCNAWLGLRSLYISDTPTFGIRVMRAALRVLSRLLRTRY